MKFRNIRIPFSFNYFTNKDYARYTLHCNIYTFLYKLRETHMKIAALDIGDVWVGVAISDPLGIIAKPLETVKFPQLKQYIASLIEKEKIQTIVIGYPKTMRGTESEQTKKIVTIKQELEQQISNVQWILWDERLSSKRAATHKKTTTKEEKIKSHAIAAAYILEGYLQYLNSLQNS